MTRAIATVFGVLMDGLLMLICMMGLAAMIGILCVEALVRGWRKTAPALKWASLGIGVSLLMLMAVASNGALAHDHSRPELDDWFKQLRSKYSLCCDGSDYTRVENVDWRSQGGKYQVRIDGAWHDVPNDAVLTEPNRAGFAMVWPFKYPDGRIGIRCFMPGPMT